MTKHSLSAAATVEHRRGEPLAELARWRAGRGAGDRLLLVDFVLPQYWLPRAEPVQLTALYCMSDGRLQVAVTDQPLVADGAAAPRDQYARWVLRHGMASWEAGTSMALSAEVVAKPWGREIWYSGVEQRGVCCFARGRGQTPIPWLQAVVPEARLGCAGVPLVLLKILDPLPQPVLGDLYFELHEQKREVYVVTHVDPAAWPDGQGYLRLGFDPRRIAEYPAEHAFRQAYLDAVRAYETVRRELDAMAGQGRAPEAGQVRREQVLRDAMNRFTYLYPVRVGDVVAIPLQVPHALQHGVRTVEFQTPVYERKILSFAQRVLTQDHWDTQQAVQTMRLQAPPQATLPVLRRDQGLRLEQVVDFPDFEVRRLTLAAGASLAVQPAGRYSLVLVVDGTLDLEGAHYGSGQALFLPADWRGLFASAKAAPPLVLLWALPRSPDS